MPPLEHSRAGTGTPICLTVRQPRRGARDPRLPDSPTDKISWHLAHWSFIRRHPVEL